MQPLISPIDHESRHNSDQAEDDNDQVASENSPLLRFPPSNISGDRSYKTAIVVGLLLITLVSGVVIGIYLLVVQSNSENILPPLGMPSQLITRYEWDASADPQSLPAQAQSKARVVIVVQTDTKQCLSRNSCIELLRDMQSRTASERNPFSYNFLVSSNGQRFEALGWRRRSTLFPEYSESALVLAFIGNFTEVPPTRTQLDEAYSLIAESLSLQHLQPSFIIIGKTISAKPKYLFESLQTLPQWRSESSDM